MIVGINTYFNWSINKDTGFRKLEFTHKTHFKKEIEKFEDWDEDVRTCSKCREVLPLSLYFFNSGGVGKYHRYCKICEDAPNYGWGRKRQSEFNNNGVHYCRKCDRVLPLNEFYFIRTNGKHNRTGFTSNCKQCNGTGDNEFGLLHSLNSYQNILGIQEGFKVCHGCLIECPDSVEYFFNKEDRDIGSTRCKKCKGTEYGVYMPNVVYADQIPEGFQICMDCGILIGKIRVNSRCSACYKKYNKKLNNSPRAVVYRKEYYEKESTRKRVRRIGQNRRSMKANAITDLTLEEYEETLNYFNRECSYCGISEEYHLDIYSENMHQDHIIPLLHLGGYTKNNIIPACKSCNCSKGSKNLDEYYDYDTQFTEDRYNKIIKFIKVNS